MPRGVSSHHAVQGTLGTLLRRYATQHMSRAEVESVGYQWADFAEAIAQYDPALLAEGDNVLPGGERVYFISNPATGLWAARERLEQAQAT